MLISLNKWKWLRICFKKLMVSKSFIEKTYVVSTHWNCLIEVIPLCTYNILLKIRKKTIWKFTFSKYHVHCLYLFKTPKLVLKFLSLYCKLFIFAWQLSLQIRVHALPPANPLAVWLYRIYALRHIFIVQVQLFRNVRLRSRVWAFACRLIDIFTHKLTPYAYTLHWLYGCSVLCICGQLFNFYQANLYADMLSYML